MNWDAVAAVAELVAALGVIASLVYLATQIRQNTAAVRAENLRELVNLLMSSMDRITADPRDNELYLRGLKSLNSLGPEERERFWVLVAGLLSNCELIRDLRRDDLVKTGTYETSMVILDSQLSNPGVREIWNERGHLFARDFQAFVESRINPEAPAV